MEYSIKIKLIILTVIAIFAIMVICAYYSQKKTNDNSPAIKPPAENENLLNGESLINDKIYVEEKVEDFLIDNPSATEEYAQDIIYHDIAIKEKDNSICDKIKDSYWKEHCYRLLK